jgi:ketosteroid isomerase-like protein
MKQVVTDADTIRELEVQRYHAMRDGDLDALELLLADEMSYLHADASSDTKSSLLAKIRGRRLECSGALHAPDDHVILGGDTAIATGRVTGTVRVDGATISLHNRALAVWSRQDGRWRLLAYQATPVPGGARPGLEGSAAGEAR